MTLASTLSHHLKKKKSCTMDTSNSVTTYVRQRPLFERDDENERIELGSNSSSLYKPLEFIGIKPHASRTKAVLHLTGEWEGRDALLQFAQSISLLCYSLAPIGRKEIHIASEAFANARRIMILSRWLHNGAKTLRVSWSSNSSKRKDECLSPKSSSSSSDAEQQEEVEIEPIRLGSSEKDILGANTQNDSNQNLSPFLPDRTSSMHSSTIRQWHKLWRERIGTISEYLTMFGDGCEVVALLGGSSVLWRIIGGRLAARQRHGLERIAQFIFFFAFTLGLRHIELLAREQKRKLRRANEQLLQASDHIHADADASTLLQARHLSVTEALSLSNSDHRDGRKNDRSLAFADDLTLRKAEHKVFLQRKKMQLLRLERTSLRAELLFTIAEILWPQYDHVRLEGWTTLIASICHMSRLTKESRWH